MGLILSVVVQATVEKGLPELAKWATPNEAPLLFRCYAHVRSRAFDISKDSFSARSIVPFLDIVNRSTIPNCVYDPPANETPIDDNAVWTLRTTSSVQPDEELTMPYTISAR